MRDFNERKAEVLCRSEKRINERKRNRRVFFSVGVSLCLVLTVLSATGLPSKLRVSEDGITDMIATNNNDCGDTLPDTEEHDKVHRFVSVNVYGTDDASECQYTISDAAGVNCVFEQIYNILITEESHSDIIQSFSGVTSDLSDIDNDNGDAADTDDSGQDYHFELICTDGTKRSFSITENVLFDRELHIEKTLSDVELIKLLTALGVLD